MMLTLRRQRLVSNILCGVIVASVGVALAGLTWRLAGFAGSDAPAIVPVASPSAGPVDVAAAVALAPFGRPSAADAPATALPLELRGIVLASPASASTALIAPAGGRPLPYAVGAAVGGATIREIAIDRVVLDVGGRMETLAFPKATVPPAPPPGATAAAGPSDAPPPMQLLAPAAPAIAAPSAGLAERLGATPTGDGYRIGTPPADAATKAGLQAGDVIRSLNGQPLGDPARDAATLAAAQAAGTARIEVVRGGQRVTLSMPLPR